MLKLKFLLLSLFAAVLTLPASAFCGFYVAQADGDLFNDASKVAVARKGNKTVVTMANDYRGDFAEFAIVVPVPTVISREQVHITTPDPLKALDAFSAPRLAEYYDDNPCAPPEPEYSLQAAEDGLEQIVVTASRINRAADLGVTIEDEFSAGEYDIVILSARESTGLQRWLKDNGYRVPRGAGKILQSYIRSDMKFFVAKVNLAKKAETGGDWLSPIAIAYEDANFMLPIRLGTLNADGTQDLIAFMLSSEGRVEVSNYRTRKIPTNREVPLYLKEQPGSFGKFYKDVFDTAVSRVGGTGVFMEYFWDIGSCDPCAGDPPTMAHLMELGVFWMDDMDDGETVGSFKWFWEDENDKDIDWIEEQMRDELSEAYWGDDLFLTRLHVRYDARTFPMDLEFQETGDDEDFFQGRYVINVPWRGDEVCDGTNYYIEQVKARQRTEAGNVASLTSLSQEDVFARMAANGDRPFTTAPKPPRPEAARQIPEDEQRAREIYDQLLWWGGAFPDLVMPDEETEE